MAERKPVVRWDFDGFITKPWYSFKAFFYTYTGILANETNVGINEMAGAMKRGAKKVGDNPGKYGWEIYQPYLGRKVIVAPAEGDPYMYTKASAQLALKEFNPTSVKTKNQIPRGEEVHDFLNRIFLLAYPAISVAIRDGAGEAIAKVQNIADFAFVSNSETVNIREKLITRKELFKDLPGFGEKIRIVGDAKKQKIDPKFTPVQETIRLKGLSRPIYLRRGVYLRKLIEDKADFASDDIPEFGLFGAALLGINTILMVDELTPKYAVDFFQNIKGGNIINNPLEAAEIVENFSK